MPLSAIRSLEAAPALVKGFGDMNDLPLAESSAHVIPFVRCQPHMSDANDLRHLEGIELADHPIIFDFAACHQRRPRNRTRSAVGNECVSCFLVDLISRFRASLGFGVSKASIVA